MTREFEIPATSAPWRTVEVEGERFMVRCADGVVWICRLPDRTVWLLDEDKAPAWATSIGATSGGGQLPMF